MTRLVAPLLAVLAALALALPAAASGAVLAEGDATELAQTLAEATEVQGVCYGWRVAVSDPTGVEDGVDSGSSFGPGEPLDYSNPECTAGVVQLEAEVIYTSESSEAEDSATWSIESNLGKPPTVQELADLGYTVDDLLGEENDTAIVNAVGALPELVADHGEASPVPFEPAAREPGTSGEPTGNPGSDMIREHKYLLGLCALLVLGGLAWLFVLVRDAKLADRRRDQRRARRDSRRTRTSTTP